MIDDARRGLHSKRPPEYHRQRLDAFAATAWRYVFAVVALLAIGALLDALG